MVGKSMKNHMLDWRWIKQKKKCKNDLLYERVHLQNKHKYIYTHRKQYYRTNVFMDFVVECVLSIRTRDVNARAFNSSVTPVVRFVNRSQFKDCNNLQPLSTCHVVWFMGPDLDSPIPWRRQQKDVCLSHFAIWAWFWTVLVITQQYNFIIESKLSL